jgi:NADPH:quinone reductase-like Zn-dependent oxidoreductase
MAYSGGREEFMEMPLSDLARKIREGKVKLPLVGKTFRLDEIVEAHRFIENKAVGKIVVLV